MEYEIGPEGTGRIIRMNRLTDVLVTFGESDDEPAHVLVGTQPEHTIERLRVRGLLAR